MKLHVLIRKDMTKNQQAVQAGHAVAEYLVRGPKTNWTNGTLVYLSVPNEESLKQYERLLRSEWGCCPIPFYEPDMNNEMTALAVEAGFANTLIEELRLMKL